MSENQVMEVVKVRFTGNHPADYKMITRTFYVKPGTAEAQLRQLAKVVEVLGVEPAVTEIKVVAAKNVPVVA
ncbi:hypothetical protein [Weissella cibaria]|uniref:hypothetical protein n=1 Tax=Weissella cibaria TaxID=137591 RepID=UPI00168136EE|nr:hypothetical protein [Weissella cibaria]MBD1501400.1 hypothetical protein [Weissella cibaria]MCG4288302.1 hypothetical protein [Weissella cibaria]